MVNASDREKGSENNDEATNEENNKPGTKAKKAEKQKTEDYGFISVQNLTAREIDMLWQVAIDKCFEMAYMVTFSDKNTGNIAAETKGADGASSSIRVNFSSQGIKIDVKANDLVYAFAGGLDRKRMHAALEAKLKEMNRITSTQETQSVEAVGSLSIFEVQKILASAGYNPGPIDGKMGPKTRAAIAQFQKDKGLQGTGNLDTETQAKLKNLQ